MCVRGEMTIFTIVLNFVMLSGWCFEMTNQVGNFRSELGTGIFGVWVTNIATSLRALWVT